MTICFSRQTRRDIGKQTYVTYNANTERIVQVEKDTDTACAHGRVCVYCVCTLAFGCMNYTCIRTCIPYMHTYMHTYIHTRIRTDTPTDVYTNAHKMPTWLSLRKLCRLRLPCSRSIPRRPFSLPLQVFREGPLSGWGAGCEGFRVLGFWVFRVLGSRV